MQPLDLFSSIRVVDSLSFIKNVSSPTRIVATYIKCSLVDYHVVFDNEFFLQTSHLIKNIYIWA
jgi:hypothetical protein